MGWSQLIIFPRGLFVWPRKSLRPLGRMAPISPGTAVRPFHVRRWTTRLPAVFHILPDFDRSIAFYVKDKDRIADCCPIFAAEPHLHIYMSSGKVMPRDRRYRPLRLAICKLLINTLSDGGFCCGTTFRYWISVGCIVWFSIEIVVHLYIFHDHLRKQACLRVRENFCKAGLKISPGVPLCQLAVARWGRLC